MALLITFSQLAIDAVHARKPAAVL